MEVVSEIWHPLVYARYVFLKLFSSEKLAFCFLFFPSRLLVLVLLVSFLVSFEDFRFTFTSPPRAFIPSLSLTNL